MDGSAKPFSIEINLEVSYFRGGILICVREDIPCKLLNDQFFRGY